MSQTLRSIMRADPVTIETDEPVSRAAELMRDHDIGDVLVLEEGTLVGILTDRDIVVRAVASHEGSLATVPCGSICSDHVVRLGPEDTFDDAATVMADNALRRVPVVENERVVGIVSLGDLAVEAEEASVLAEISAAPPHV
jgi:CBS domain-containing protein